MTWTEEMRRAWRGDCIGAGCPCCTEPKRLGGTVSHTRTPRSTRDRTCSDCGATLPKGERYRREDGISSNTGWVVCRCLDADACAARVAAMPEPEPLPLPSPIDDGLGF